MTGLYYYKLVSEYPEDVTKNCKLTINEIDSNFKTLKDYDIKTAEFARDEKTLILTRNNGDKLIVPLNDVTYNLDVNSECGESGVTLTISYDGDHGKKEVTIANILTAENLMDIIGSDILTKVITDGTLKGNGTMDSPIGIAGVEKTGMLAPAIEVFDLTTGGTLPEVARLGTRYVTKEYISDYGYLYNGAGLNKIQQKMAIDRRGWRVPSKADWDALLNSIEPCEYRNHTSAKCHVELGKYAGKFLKSECGWCNQPDCDCTITKPNTGCTYEDEDYVSDGTGYTEGEVPPYSLESPVGVDKYGMAVLPAGNASFNVRYARPEASQFGEQAFFWTTTHIYGDSDQDRYVKVFDCEKGGVSQYAECPDPYFSVRLVKDYDGQNYFDSEYIDGVLYKTILFPESGQIWLASNFASKEGFIEYEAGGEIPELLEVNNGEVLEKRVEMFINEWNGHYWEKKKMNEGDTIVIENPCFDQGTGTTTNVCWTDKEGLPHCIEVEIPKESQSNIEYRVFTEDESCNKVLVNTDDLVVERIVQIIVPMLQREREERIEGDRILDEKIDAEIERATTVEGELWDAIAQEASARTDVDNQIWTALNNEIQGRLDVDAQMWAAINAEAEARETTDNLLWQAVEDETKRAQEVEAQLWDGINGETARAQEVEAQLWESLNNEIQRAIAREDEIDGQLVDWSENPFTISVAVGKDEDNLVLETKDKNPEHFIKVKFDGSFGEI